jgi:hypothetical protein
MSRWAHISRRPTGRATLEACGPSVEGTSKMAKHRNSRGMPWLSLWQMAVLAVVFSGAWLLWSEFREHSQSPGQRPEQHDVIGKLQSIEALSQQGPESVPALVEMASSADAQTRRLALFGLGLLGPEAEEALEVIRARLSDEDRATWTCGEVRRRRPARDCSRPPECRA